MRNFLRATLATLAVGLLSSAAQAIPVALTIGDGYVPGFKYSQLHTCHDQSCMSGWNLGDMSGELIGDLKDGVLLNLEGEIHIGGVVNTTYQTSGYFDFTDGGAGGKLLLEGLGEFEFANTILAGPANSFDGTNIYAWGGLHGNCGYRYGMDLGGTVGPVPEPSAALLFGMGTLVVGAHSRRRR